MDKKRNTLQRQLVMNAVRELDIHASAEQVFEYVAEKHSSISKATVYRNLKQLAEAGELADIGTFCGAVHYDHNCHEHYHFVCENCEKICDVEGDMTDIYNKIKHAEGIEITGFRLSFTGLCEKCKRGNHKAVKYNS